MNCIETAGKGEVPHNRQLWARVQGGESQAGQGEPPHLPRQQQFGGGRPLYAPVDGGPGGERGGGRLPGLGLACPCQADLHHQDCQCIQPGTAEQQK